MKENDIEKPKFNYGWFIFGAFLVLGLRILWDVIFDVM